ncbi:TrfB-related DNA-binding protein [Pseudomonas sp. P5_152]|uniref:TrfB-related DNA-binding protein n=1 Tax=Pseudomonas sp. P5_152 TaxID=3043442 RepID=UPI002A35CFB0|nr:TrfB-related DNA-binding protein [Pseudomonas sp. P5_152]MDX9668607.1 TrfB-related DNA-binding protein [Pseudomonas sp. P5_152]
MTETSSNEDKLVNMAAKIKEAFEPAEIAQLVRLIGPTPSTGEMSPEEFERLMTELQAKSTRRGFSDKSIQAARLVLVMGASIPEAAADTNLTRQAVNQLMQRIRRRMESLPDGWVRVTDWFPVEVAKQLEDIAETLKAAHGAGDVLDGQTFKICI